MPDGRRRLAAIMFLDMVGWSALTQRDESLALKLVDEQRKLLRPVFGRFAGTEVKTMGDGALVVFDSALDATECAVEIQRLLFERNRDGSGERIEMRVGVHVGDVVHTTDDVYGDAVNIASRVEPLAEAGGVCVTGPVFEQVQNKIAYPFRVVERAVLKNITTPVSVYRIELPWTPPSLSEATPFTDRKDELELLRRTWSGIAAKGGSAIALTGEAGVGKTRLAEELISLAERDGARVLRGKAERGGISAPFAPWSQAVRRMARELPNPMLNKFCVDCAVEVSQLVPELGPRLGREPEGLPGEVPSEERLFEGVLRLLGNLSRAAPVIVLLDDVQWSDSASLHLLEYVAHRLADYRVLVLVGYRDEQTPEQRGLEDLVEALVRDQRMELVRLHRFDADASVQLLRQMLRGRLPASGGELAGRLYEKSGGNPMILEAIVRTLAGEGSLVWTEDGWGPKPGVAIHLPPGIQSDVRQRLARLSPPTVEVLRQASVLGPRFSFDALQRVTSIAPDELLPRLEEAIQAHILDERPTGSGRSAYAFTDRPVPETLYDEISLVRRTRYHATVARVLEGMAEAGSQFPAAVLAHHFLLANEYDKALEYTLKAAEESVRLFAREEALRQYATAQELLESQPDERRRAEVMSNIGEQQDLLGRHSEAYRTLREAAEIYERLGLTAEAGGVYTSIARRLTYRNEPVRAAEHLEQARRLLESGPPSVELARLYDTMGLVMYQEVRLPEAAANWTRAIDIAGKVDEFRIGASARRMLASTIPPAESARVWEYLEEALALATKSGARPVVSDVMVVKSLALVHIRGDARGALRVAEDAVDYARRGHDVLNEMFVKGNLITYIEWRSGDLHRAEQVALEHRAFVGGDPRRDRPTAIAVLADVALARGEIDRAEKLLWEGERLMAEGGDWTESAHVQLVLARCALVRQKPLSAVEHLRIAYELGRRAGPPAIDALFLVETLALLVRAHLDAAELSEAERHLGELASLTETLGENLGNAYRLRSQGWVQAHRGEMPAATASLEESLALWKRLGWQYEWAQTLLSLAEVVRVSGDKKRAGVLADQATEFLSKVVKRSDPRVGGPVSS